MHQHQEEWKCLKESFLNTLTWNGGLSLSFSLLSPSPSLSPPEDPTQIGKGISLITVSDINDNAPVFAIDYETLLCENALPGQVRPSILPTAASQLRFPFLSPRQLEVWLTKTARWLSKPLKPFLVPQNKSAVHISRLAARGHPGEKASLVWDTSLRFNSTYCKVLSFIRDVTLGPYCQSRLN